MGKTYLKYVLFLFLIGGFLSLPAQGLTDKPAQKNIQKSAQKTAPKTAQKTTAVGNKKAIQKNKLAKELVEASQKGDLEQTRTLIKQGADINGIYTPPNTCHPMESGCSAPKSQTPLLAACETAHWDIVKELVNAKANVNKSNSRKETPLMFASKSGNNEMVKILIAAGAKVNAKSDSYSSATGHKAYTALYFACKFGYEEIVKTLLSAGAKVNLKGAENALTAAARGGYLGIVKKLLAAGAWVNPWEHKNKPKSDTGEIQIIFMYDSDSRACPNPLRNAIDGRNIEIVKLLVKAGANVSGPDCDNTTPLKAAIMDNQVETVKILVKAGAPVDVKDTDGVTGKSYTPLEFAYDMGNVEIIKILQGGGASLDKKDTTALIEASASGQTDKVKKLIAAGIDVNLQEAAPRWLSTSGRCEAPSLYSATGQSALQKASEGGHLEVVKLLLAAGAKVDDKNIVGDTALVLAGKRGYTEIVKALLAAGADANTKNNCGTTALKIAQKAKQPEVVEILKQAGAKE